MSKKSIIGTCALCNSKNIKLTKEHIFPGAKRNRSNNLPFEATLFTDTISTPMAKGLYCTRFFRPLPKGRLCYNDNLYLKGVSNGQTQKIHP